LNHRIAAILLIILSALLFASCDSGAPSTPASAGATATVPAEAPSVTPGNLPPSEPSPLPSPTGTVIDTAEATAPVLPSEEAASPTPVTATSSGEPVTALQAFAQLRPRAMSWQPDARLVMMANVRPGQEAKLLGVALGDPDVNEPTPGGKGRNWALIAFSPSTKTASAFAMDGTDIDLSNEGVLTDNLIQSFSAPELSALALSAIQPSQLVDSDSLPAKAGASNPQSSIGIALLAPDGLGIGPLPTPETGGASPQLAYELFSSDQSAQSFTFFNAATGQVVLDSTAP
jgi:hypothetical protein